LPLLFPEGRPPSPRWRPLAILVLADCLVQMPIEALRPGPLVHTDPLTSADVPVGRNPIALVAMEPVVSAYDVFTGVVFFPLLAALVASVVERYRRALGIERYQLRWFLFAVAVQPTTYVVSAPVANGLLAGRTWYGVSELLPLAPAAAVAIVVLRYRLYEIDRIISRTATYAIVSAVLATVYAVVAVVPSTLFRLDSDLLVAAATVASAAVFVPLRRRVQSVVDRRFNRARYDARQVVDRFSSRLRAEVDITHLTDELRRVVGATVQPAHVTLWLAGDRT
jgi:hypothetical protein